MGTQSCFITLILNELVFHELYGQTGSCRVIYEAFKEVSTTISNMLV